MAAFFSPFFLNSLSVHHTAGTAAAAGQRNATLAGMLLRWHLNLGRAGSKGHAWLEIQWLRLWNIPGWIQDGVSARFYLCVDHKKEIRLNPDFCTFLPE